MRPSLRVVRHVSETFSDSIYIYAWTLSIVLHRTTTQSLALTTAQLWFDQFARASHAHASWLCSDPGIVIMFFL